MKLVLSIMLLLAGCEFNNCRTVFKIQNDVCLDLISERFILVKNCQSGKTYINPKEYMAVRECKLREE